MKLIINSDNFYFEITNKHKLFKKNENNKTILKKGNYKSELANYFNDLKSILTNKEINKNYIKFNKGLRKFKYSLNDENLNGFILKLKQTNLNELEIIYKNMFEN